MIFLKKNDTIQINTETSSHIMSIDTEAPSYKKSILEFKSTSFSVPVLALYSTELKQIKHHLQEKIAQAPDFFKNSPLLIDLQYCNDQKLSIDLTALIKFLHTEQLFPIGLCHGNEEQNTIAFEFHIPVHTIRGPHTIVDFPAQSASNDNETKTSDTKTKESESTVENMFISQPVRSGQRIYAKGDLTILSHVSAGAEIMAEGNIHVYGALRGRALAGVQGNIDSRIFCSTLQAELISIAGHYKTSEELGKVDSNKTSHIFLKDKALIINNL